MDTAPGPKRRPLAAVNANCGAIRWGSNRLPKPPSAKTAIKSRRPHATHLVTTVTVAPRGGGGGGGGGVGGGAGRRDGDAPAALPDPRGKQELHAIASLPFAFAGDGGVAALTGEVEYLELGSTAASTSPADALVDTDDDDESGESSPGARRQKNPCSLCVGPHIAALPCASPHAGEGADRTGQDETDADSPLYRPPTRPRRSLPRRGQGYRCLPHISIVLCVVDFR